MGTGGGPASGFVDIDQALLEDVDDLEDAEDTATAGCKYVDDHAMVYPNCYLIVEALTNRFDHGRQ